MGMKQKLNPLSGWFDMVNSTGTQPGDVVVLDSNGKVPVSTLPAIALNETYTADSEQAMLALDAQTGDLCERTDQNNKLYILVGDDASVLSNWKDMYAVTSVNGQTGDVTVSTFQAFPNTFNTTGTTTQFLSSISTLNLPVGSAYLGQVSLSDMPEGVTVQGDVEVYIYPQNIVYAVMRSAEIPPYIWSVNSYENRGREPECNMYNGTTAPTDITEGMLWYDSTNDVYKYYDGTNWIELQKKIDANNKLSVDSIAMEAGIGIEFGGVEEKDTKGPSPSGYHIPTQSEWQGIYNILVADFGLVAKGTTAKTYLKMPYAGYRDCDESGNMVYRGSYASYWTASEVGLGATNSSYAFFIGDYNFNPQYGSSTGYAFSIRCFKNTPVAPDSSWTTLYDGSSVATGAGVFHNSTEGLISLSSDGTNWITIMDKNLGATVVYNDGDTLSEANCGKCYQWGNNYGFSGDASVAVTTSSTQVDGSAYGPGNYYSSSIFITRTRQYSVRNNNLWGGATNGTWEDDSTIKKINNIGVTSVNGQTGNVTVTFTQVQADYAQTDNTQADFIKNKPTIQEYQAGTGISFNGIEEKDTKGPALSGFHIPTITEWQSVYNIIVTTFGLTGKGNDFKTYLKMPFAGYREADSSNVYSQGLAGQYLSSSRYNNTNSVACISFYANGLTCPSQSYQSNACSLRPFKNISIAPDSSWTTLYDGSSVATGAGIFHNSTEGLISISGDGTTWITISDKNLGATTVYNNDTLSEANCGKYYQWGNNYGFPWSGTLTNISPDQVDATGYGPGNYYSSETFITRTSMSPSWESSGNRNLWGGETNGTWEDDSVKKVNNTGVLSVNGQTGDVTVGDMKYADYNFVTLSGASVTLSLCSKITPSANFTVNAPATIKDGQAYLLRVENGATAYTMTLGTGITNPDSASLTLEANKINQFVFLATGGNLELQKPAEGGGGGSSVGLTSDLIFAPHGAYVGGGHTFGDPWHRIDVEGNTAKGYNVDIPFDDTDTTNLLFTVSTVGDISSVYVDGSNCILYVYGEKKLKYYYDPDYTYTFQDGTPGVDNRRSKIYDWSTDTTVIGSDSHGNDIMVKDLILVGLDTYFAAFIYHDINVGSDDVIYMYSISYLDLPNSEITPTLMNSVAMPHDEVNPNLDNVLYTYTDYQWPSGYTSYYFDGSNYYYINSLSGSYMGNFSMAIISESSVDSRIKLGTVGADGKPFLGSLTDKVQYYGYYKWDGENYALAWTGIGPRLLTIENIEGGGRKLYSTNVIDNLLTQKQNVIGYTPENVALKASLAGGIPEAVVDVYGYDGFAISFTDNGDHFYGVKYDGIMLGSCATPYSPTTEEIEQAINNNRIYQTNRGAAVISADGQTLVTKENSTIHVYVLNTAYTFSDGYDHFEYYRQNNACIFEETGTYYWEYNDSDNEWIKYQTTTPFIYDENNGMAQVGAAISTQFPSETSLYYYPTFIFSDDGYYLVAQWGSQAHELDFGGSYMYQMSTPYDITTIDYSNPKTMLPPPNQGVGAFLLGKPEIDREEIYFYVYWNPTGDSREQSMKKYVVDRSLAYPSWEATTKAAAEGFKPVENTTATSSLTISDLTTVFTPTQDFTIAAGTVMPGMSYIVRLTSGATAYTMTLGTGITNPYGETLTLTASKTTTLVLFATSDSTLEVFGIKTAQ